MRIRDAYNTSLRSNPIPANGLFMNSGEPIGCLGTILSMLGIRLHAPTNPAISSYREEIEEPIVAESAELAYRVRDDFLSAAEFSFFRVLVSATGNRAVICCKVRLADIFYVARPHEHKGQQSRIQQKHVDFLLCDPVTMQPRCAIELDDSTHARKERQERDDFVERAFAAAKLPLVRVPVQRGYNPAGLLSLIESHLSDPPALPTTRPSATVSGPQLCPKCGAAMVVRTAKNGPNAGQKFLGCSNYPKCQTMAKL